MKALLAYGSKHVASRLAERLRRVSGIEIIVQAHDTADAMAQAISTSPELVVVDLFLPGGSGLVLLKHVKDNLTRSTVMMTTGSVFPQDRRQCLRSGADFFFHLPDEVGRLILAIAELARNDSSASPGTGESQSLQRGEDVQCNGSMI